MISRRTLFCRAMAAAAALPILRSMPVAAAPATPPHVGITGTLPVEPLTDEIIPVGLVDGLPDPASSPCSTVFDIRTEKLFRRFGDEWRSVYDDTLAEI